MSSTVLIDYGSGNLASAEKALIRAADGDEITVTDKPDIVARADRVVLPGVGAFAACMGALEARPGLVEAMTEAVQARGAPFLGVCVGMQLLATRGLEHAVVPGLDRIPGEVRMIEPADKALKVPHMGWNTLSIQREHPLFEGIAFGETGWHAYFLHSYHLAAARAEDVVAVADYGGPVTAIVARETVAGTQFHPEKSQRLGLTLIDNFLKWSP